MSSTYLKKIKIHLSNMASHFFFTLSIQAISNRHNLLKKTNYFHFIYLNPKTHATYLVISLGYKSKRVLSIKIIKYLNREIGLTTLQPILKFLRYLGMTKHTWHLIRSKLTLISSYIFKLNQKSIFEQNFSVCLQIIIMLK